MEELIFRRHCKPTQALIKLISMKTILPIVITGFIFLASCSTGHKMSSYIAKIDSLAVVLEKDAAIYNSIDTTLVITNFANMNIQLETLDSLTDISTFPDAIAYTYLRQSYKLFLMENPLIIKEIGLAKDQLIDLKYDAENKLISNTELQIYIEQESKALTALQNRMELFQKRINSQLKNYELLNPKIEFLLDSLSQN